MYKKTIIYLLFLYTNHYALFIINIDNLSIKNPLIIIYNINSENNIINNNTTILLNSAFTIFKSNVYIKGTDNNLLCYMQNLPSFDTPDYFIVLNENNKVEKNIIPDIVDSYVEILTNTINPNKSNNLILNINDNKNSIIIGNPESTLTIDSKIMTIENISSTEDIIDIKNDITINNINIDNAIMAKDIYSHKQFQVKNTNIIINSPLNLTSKNFTSNIINTNNIDQKNPNITTLIGNISILKNFLINSDIIKFNSNNETVSPNYFLALNPKNKLYKTDKYPSIELTTNIIESPNNDLYLNINTINQMNGYNLIFNTKNFFINSESISRIYARNLYSIEKNSTITINKILRLHGIFINNNNEIGSCIINNLKNDMQFIINADNPNYKTELCKSTNFYNIIPTSNYYYYLSFRAIDDLKSAIMIVSSIPNNEKNTFIYYINTLLEIYYKINQSNIKAKKEYTLYKENYIKYQKIKKLYQKLDNDIKNLKNKYKERLENHYEDDIHELFLLLNSED